MRLTNGIPLGYSLLLPVGTVNLVETLKPLLFVGFILAVFAKHGGPVGSAADWSRGPESMVAALNTLAVISFNFACHFNIIPILSGMKRPAGMTSVRPVPVHLLPLTLRLGRHPRCSVPRITPLLLPPPSPSLDFFLAGKLSYCAECVAKKAMLSYASCQWSRGQHHPHPW
jgi:hypothetical protein